MHTNKDLRIIQIGNSVLAGMLLIFAAFIVYKLIEDFYSDKFVVSLFWSTIILGLVYKAVRSLFLIFSEDIERTNVLRNQRVATLVISVPLLLITVALGVDLAYTKFSMRLALFVMISVTVIAYLVYSMKKLARIVQDV
jgi:hypothetical protein